MGILLEFIGGIVLCAVIIVGATHILNNFKRND